MKSFFYNVKFVAKYGENVQPTTAWGTAKFDVSKPLEPQIISELETRGTASLVIGPINITAFTPIELESTNHTDRIMEIWRIRENEGEYYGGMNTNAWVNQELAKLGLSL